MTDASLFSAEYEDSLRILGETCGVSERAKTVTEFINSVIADLRARTENIPDDDKPSILAAAATFKGATVSRACTPITRCSTSFP